MASNNPNRLERLPVTSDGRRYRCPTHGEVYVWRWRLKDGRLVNFCQDCWVEWVMDHVPWVFDDQPLDVPDPDLANGDST